MAVISLKGGRYELVAWWRNQQGQLTPKVPPVFATLQEAVAAANHLIFHRVDSWSRLMGDD